MGDTTTKVLKKDIGWLVLNCIFDRQTCDTMPAQPTTTTHDQYGMCVTYGSQVTPVDWVMVQDQMKNNKPVTIPKNNTGNGLVLLTMGLLK
jgi:hypothetical protein